MKLLETLLFVFLTSSLFSQASIECTVWFDVDNNGLFELTGGGCSDVVYTSFIGEFQLYKDGVFVKSMASGLGQISDNNIPPGDNYQIRAHNENISNPTIPHADGTVDDLGDSDIDSDFINGRSPLFLLVNGEHKTNIDLGIHIQGVPVSGHIWSVSDINDGLRPYSIPTWNTNVTVQLCADYDGDGEFTDIVMTVETNKYYMFSSVQNGTYVVKLARENFLSGAVLENHELDPYSYPIQNYYHDFNNGIGRDNEGAIISDPFVVDYCIPTYLDYIFFNFGLYDLFDCILTTDNTTTDHCAELAIYAGAYFAPYCDLKDLDGFCEYVPFDYFGAPPSSCISGITGTPKWISFIAGTGNYSVDITSGDYDGDANTQIHAGIIQDCDVESTIACVNSNCDELTTELNISNIENGSYVLIPGQTYYLYVATCGRMGAKIQININGDFIPYIPNLPNVISVDNTTQDQEDILVADLGDEIKVSIDQEAIEHFSYSWRIRGEGAFTINGELNTGNDFTSTSTNFTVQFDIPGDYEICWFKSESECSGDSQIGNLCKEITILGPPTALINLCPFRDEDRNGQVQFGEPLLPSVVIDHYAVENSQITDQFGCTKLELELGPHELVTTINYGNWRSRVKIHTISIDSETPTTYYLPIQPLAQEDTLEVSINTSSFRCGLNRLIRPKLVNPSSQIIGGKLQFILDPRLTFVESDISPFSVNGDTLLYVVEELTPGMCYIPKILVTSPGPEFIGDTLIITARALDGFDNQLDVSTYETILRCSYDPNDKQVTPQRIEVDNPTLRSEHLDYTIRFQNTGNHYAQNVTLVDEFSEDLDLESLLFLESSHDVEIFLDNRTITFEFKDIYLIDSLSNPELSKGYISFSVKQQRNLPIGHKIFNIADIYFDSNPPIRTNKTINTIVESLPCKQAILTDIGLFQVCSGDSIMIANQTIRNEGSHLIHAGISSNGCDSMLLLSLDIFEVNQTDIGRLSICSGDSLNMADHVFSNSGMHTLNLSNTAGCDSIVVFELRLEDVSITDLGTVNICSGESYNIGDSIFTNSGLSTVHFISSGGCDSMVFADLIVNQKSIMDAGLYTICEGDEISIGSTLYTDAGNYEESIGTNINGCDSLVTFTIEVGIIDETNLGEFISCKENEIVVDGIAYVEADEYIKKLINQAGCDSIISFTISHYPRYSTVLGEFEICPTDSVLVGNTYYTNPGPYHLTASDINGCDSLIEFTIVLLKEDDITCSPLGTDYLEEEKISIYPNPFSDEFNIHLEANQHIEYRLLDLSGKEVLQGSGTKVNTTDFIDGIYILKLRIDGRIYSRKVIKV